MAEAAAAVADLANDTTSPDLRRRTAWGLRNFNTAAAPHIPVLLQLLKDPDERTRYGAVFALAALKLRPREVVPALIEMLSDPKEHIRQTAASGLRGMADEVEKLQPGFINTLGDLGKADFERDKLLREDFNKREAKRLERLKAKSVPKK